MLVKRLGFLLPDFLRVVWFSEAVRHVWAPRIGAIQDTWSDIEWRSVCKGHRAAALLVVPRDIAHASVVSLARQGLSAIVVDEQEETVQLAAGPAEKAAMLSAAVENARHDEIGALLGYPECCRAFFLQRVIEERYIDTIWHTAAGCGTWRSPDRALRIGNRAVGLAGLLAPIGIRIVAHAACSCDCAATSLLAAQFDELYDAGDLHLVRRWRDELLAMPMTWSSLHGIARVETPILRLYYATDAFAEVVVVEANGQEPKARMGRSRTHLPLAQEIQLTDGSRLSGR